MMFKKVFRKIGIIILNLVFNHSLVYLFLGLLNKFLGKPVKTIFTVYPADEKYIEKYLYRWYAASMKWKPRLAGVFKQNKKWGIVFGISATEEDFLE